MVVRFLEMLGKLDQDEVLFSPKSSGFQIHELIPEHFLFDLRWVNLGVPEMIDLQAPLHGCKTNQAPQVSIDSEMF